MVCFFGTTETLTHRKESGLLISILFVSKGMPLFCSQLLEELDENFTRTSYLKVVRQYMP